MEERKSIFRAPYEALPEPENSLTIKDIVAQCDVEDCRFNKTGNIYVELGGGINYLAFGGVLIDCRNHHSATRGEDGEHNSFTLLKGDKSIGHVSVSIAAFAGFVWSLDS